MKPRFNKNLPYPQKPIPVLCSSKEALPFNSLTPKVLLS